MYACIGFVMCFFVGSSVAYYPQREAPYNRGPSDPFLLETNARSFDEPSQRLFWGNQGSNQVGGTGLWAHLTNKFPFLGNMFGRLEVPTQYGVPNQYDVPSTQYGPPTQYNVPSTQYGAPGVNRVPYYPQQQQIYQQPQPIYQQSPAQFGQRFVPSARDVGITDDAIIVTPPFVPPIAQPAPAPVPVPAPIPSPEPVPVPGQGYSYNKPQYRLELPHK